ncbi:Protein of unknown function [Hydrobacter penzbergensis]|uniref:DUF3347 domain-containing protein n=1 Tax=Hydrobacter penzbergensis TaxID=1235997 RepID=A0A8X8I8T5_9BACT|nr:DUF3347 domain-containing protein [Hydrobacter penzbergensis]SDW14537.1 Protein of unknown function [Hydrobacter penzbergensis]
MKKLIVIATLFCFTSTSVFAQHDLRSNTTERSNSATIASDNKNVSQLLNLYYNIKDALVADNANAASAKAAEFVKTANSIDFKVISEGNINALLKDAGRISETKDIKQQRNLFANLSNNMTALAKAVKLTDLPVYQQYCPMKKAYWLSSEQAIKNPYFGSSMLTCGKVTETLK